MHIEPLPRVQVPLGVSHVPLVQFAVAEPVSGPVESVPVLLLPCATPLKLAEQAEPGPQLSVAVLQGAAAVQVPLGAPQVVPKQVAVAEPV